MTPRMPQISVRPLATRNSNSPYWIAFGHWTRKTATLIGSAAQPAVAREARQRSLHVASLRRIRERLHGDAFVAILGADDLAQIDVLHRVVRLRQRDSAPR